MESNHKLISILITHYNRAEDLLKCLDAIHDLKLSNYEVVVSDDCSKDDVIAQLKTFNIDQLVLAEVNGGLAANINKGLKACKGDYILYCQEDFKLDPNIKTIIPECLSVLDNNKADLVRFTSNFKFNQLKELTNNIALIPKFSFSNFSQNFYQYSDHPFLTTNTFHDRFGLYMENTSGRFGETEYCIRICNSDAKIAITYTTLASLIEGSESILIHDFKTKRYKTVLGKPIYKFARALRLYFEWLFYNKNKRGLITYKNARS